MHGTASLHRSTRSVQLPEWCCVRLWHMQSCPAISFSDAVHPMLDCVVSLAYFISTFLRTYMYPVVYLMAFSSTLVSSLEVEAISEACKGLSASVTCCRNSFSRNNFQKLSCALSPSASSHLLQAVYPSFKENSWNDTHSFSLFAAATLYRFTLRIQVEYLLLSLVVSADNCSSLLWSFSSQRVLVVVKMLLVTVVLYFSSSSAQIYSSTAVANILPLACLEVR